MIGTNKKDATETVELLLDDARTGLLPRPRRGHARELLEERGVEAVLYAGWEAIDRRARRRRAARPAAAQAVHLGRTARRRQVRKDPP